MHVSLMMYLTEAASKTQFTLPLNRTCAIHSKFLSFKGRLRGRVNLCDNVASRKTPAQHVDNQVHRGPYLHWAEGF